MSGATPQVEALLAKERGPLQGRRRCQGLPPFVIYRLNKSPLNIPKVFLLTRQLTGPIFAVVPATQAMYSIEAVYMVHSLL